MRVTSTLSRSWRPLGIVAKIPNAPTDISRIERNFLCPEKFVHAYGVELTPSAALYSTARDTRLIIHTHAVGVNCPALSIVCIFVDANGLLIAVNQD